MKKPASQVVVAVVCAILGFLLAYQFKLISSDEKVQQSVANANLLSEIDSLKQEKEDLQEANSKLSQELKTIEENATAEGEVEKEIKKQLDNARMQLGLVDVTGPGLVITITPKNNIFSSNSSEATIDLGSEELIHLTNILWFSRAEAISINDFRLTPQTGIMASGNYLWIGSAGKISPKEQVVIKVIGDKSRLNAGITFQSSASLSYGALANYDVTVKQVDDIVLTQSTQTLRSDYLKTVTGK